MAMTLRGTVALALLSLAAPAAQAVPDQWVGTWGSSPQLAEPGNRPAVPSLSGYTLRQVVHVSLGGGTVRLRLSNQFGDSPLSLASVHLARSTGAGGIDPGTDCTVTFSGLSAVALPAGTALVSDPVGFKLRDGEAIAVTLKVLSSPHDYTAHPGSRTTSYIQAGDFISERTLPNPLKVDHWYFITGLDVVPSTPSAATLVILGDSITDGRGSTTNGNDRWPDRLVQRFETETPAVPVGVLNEGIGGNRILHNGLGPAAVVRFGRDVLAQPGIRWLIIFEGINDLGGGASAKDIIAADQNFVAQAHARHLKVLGGTITPFDGFSMYYRPATEAERQTVNQWIRAQGNFDGVIDFDLATRDPAHPTRLAAEYDSGDHLHLNPVGYARMAQAVDLRIFRE